MKWKENFGLGKEPKWGWENYEKIWIRKLNERNIMSKYVIELMRRLTVKEIEEGRNEKMIESVSKGERESLLVFR